MRIRLLKQHVTIHKIAAVLEIFFAVATGIKSVCDFGCQCKEESECEATSSEYVPLLLLGDYECFKGNVICLGGRGYPENLFLNVT